MCKKVSYEIRFWHGTDEKSSNRWVIPNEPEYLPSGALRFTCAKGLEHYITGTIEVIKRA